MAFSLALSDGLADLRLEFVQFMREPRVIEPGDASALVSICELLERRARELECEVSKQLWNDAARADRMRLADEEAHVLAEAARPGTNLVLLSRIGVPFSDGRPVA